MLGKMTALGIVFGDLGTSPLYTIQTIVRATGTNLTPEGAVGMLSLIVWTLVVTISLKYCVVVLKADNRGEGGILSLMTLAGAGRPARRIGLYTFMGLLGAALLYGDGVITPAISVLSALEGLTTHASRLQALVLPTAVAVLVALFAMQRQGTERIGRAFAPIMLLWFIVIGTLGAASVARHPAVLAALDPRHALLFLVQARGAALLVLGGVFLCVTGGEALYADIGHFGKASIRWSWYLVVLPAVLLSYAGQAAWLAEHGSSTGNPFFLIAPSWGVYVLVALATVATVIASQAVITGAFSMTRQAMQLGWLPDVAIRQTSDRIYGQIYIPVVNWLMMMATIAIAVAFGSSGRLSGAYGTAVASTMLLTTALLYPVMRRVWHWPVLAALLVSGLLWLFDGTYFVANLLKVADGGWLPLTLAAALFVVMITWRSGCNALHAALDELPQSAARCLEGLRAGSVPRVPGTGIFLTAGAGALPRLVLDHLHFSGALPDRAIALSVLFADEPRIRVGERVRVEEVAEGFWHVTLRFGFVEVPDIRRALAGSSGLPAALDLDNAVYFGARDLVVHRPGSGRFRRGRVWLFGFLCRNTAKVVDRFNLPPDNVVELARQFRI